MNYEAFSNIDTTDSTDTIDTNGSETQIQLTEIEIIENNFKDCHQKGILTFRTFLIYKLYSNNTKQI